MREADIKVICPKCLRGWIGESLACPSCGELFSMENSLTDLRLVKSDDKTGWKAGVFDRIYSTRHFPDSRDDFRVLGIPEYAEEYRISRRDGPIIDFFAKFAPRRILDSGCGDGFFARKIAAMLHESQIYGVDVSPHRVARFCSAAAEKSGHLHPVLANSEHLPFEELVFDAVLMRESLEHFFDPAKSILEASRVLVPGGHIMISTPSKMMFDLWRAAAFLPSLLRRLFTGRKIFEDSGSAAYDRPVSVGELKSYFLSAGLEICSWDKAVMLPHESYLQFIPEFLLKPMIQLADAAGRIRLLRRAGLHHIIVLRKMGCINK